MVVQTEAEVKEVEVVDPMRRDGQHRTVLRAAALEIKASRPSNLEEGRRRALRCHWRRWRAKMVEARAELELAERIVQRLERMRLAACCLRWVDRTLVYRFGDIHEMAKKGNPEGFNRKVRALYSDREFARKNPLKAFFAKVAVVTDKPTQWMEKNRARHAAIAARHEGARAVRSVSLGDTSGNTDEYACDYV